MKTKNTKKNKSVIYYYGFTRSSAISRGGSRQCYRIRGSAVDRWSETHGNWCSMCRRDAKTVRQDLPARTYSKATALEWVRVAPVIGTPGTIAIEYPARFTYTFIDREGREEVLARTSSFTLMKEIRKAVYRAVLGL